MVAAVWSAVLQGVSATLVRIEASASSGLPQVRIVGMPATDVKESLDRVRQALRALGIALPARRIVINLFPASLRKTGSQLDMPIALALLRVAGVSLPSYATADTVFCLGEIGLDGSVHAVNGMLPLALAAQAHANYTVLLPEGAKDQLYYQPSSPVRVVRHLRDILTTKSLPTWDGWSVSTATDQQEACEACIDRSDPLSRVRGQSLAKRVLQIAIAGGHHVLLIGPPGCGKSFLAQQAAQMIPRIPLVAAQELLSIQSICGDRMRVCDVCGSVQAPLRAPHCGVTESVLIGGGAKVRPGEISRAHGGMLLLDELGEMKRSVVESLRQPLQEGVVSIARHVDRVTLPARFQLVATMNPCPCGYAGSTVRACECSPAAQERYRSLLRGPIGDRFDAIIMLEPVTTNEYITDPEEHARLRETRAVASSERVQGIHYALFAQRARRIKNAWLSEKHRSTWLQLASDDATWWAQAAKQFSVTGRGMLSMLRLARTIADIERSQDIQRTHLAQAMQLRRVMT